MSELRLPQRNLVVWFEIPVRALQPAMAFYTAMLQLNFRLERRARQTRAIFDDPGFSNTGALVEAPALCGASGTRIYLHAGPDLDATLHRAQTAGARIAAPALDLGGGLGQVAVIEDPDGNAIGLHSPAGPLTAGRR